MSREKVDKYKEQKANRKENARKAVAKKKRTRAIAIIVAVAIAAAIVLAIVVTAVNEYRAYQDAQPDYTGSSTFMLSDATGVTFSAIDETASPDEQADGTETVADTSGDETRAESETETGAETQAAE